MYEPVYNAVDHAGNSYPTHAHPTENTTYYLSVGVSFATSEYGWDMTFYCLNLPCAESSADAAGGAGDQACAEADHYKSIILH